MNLDRIEWPQEYLDELNRVLAELKEADNGQAGYRLGAVDAYLVLEAGRHPTPAMMRAAIKCTSLKDALQLARVWVTQLRRDPLYDLKGEKRGGV